MNLRTQTNRFQCPAVALAALLVGAAQIGCGPMNDRPANGVAGASATTPSPLTDDLTANGEEFVGYSKNRSFVMVMKPFGASRGEGVRPQTGDHSYQLFLFNRANNVRALSKDAQVEIEYQRGNARGRPPFKVQAQRQDDGSFVVPLSFKKNGVWKIRVRVTEGNVQDDHEFQLTI